MSFEDDDEVGESEAVEPVAELDDEPGRILKKYAKVADKPTAGFYDLDNNNISPNDWVKLRRNAEVAVLRHYRSDNFMIKLEYVGFCPTGETFAAYRKVIRSQVLNRRGVDWVEDPNMTQFYPNQKKALKAYHDFLADNGVLEEREDFEGNKFYVEKGNNLLAEEEKFMDENSTNKPLGEVTGGLMQW